MLDNFRRLISCRMWGSDLAICGLQQGVNNSRHANNSRDASNSENASNSKNASNSNSKSAATEGRKQKQDTRDATIAGRPSNSGNITN